MDLQKENEENSGLFIDSPNFYSKAFSLAARQRKIINMRDGDNFKRVCAEEYDALSSRVECTRLQDACAVRNVLRTRRLANLLISDKGEINLAALPKVIAYLTRHLYSLGPNRQYDSKRQEHLLRVLNLLNQNKEIIRLVKNIDKPMYQRHAEQLIRDTLQLPPSVQVTDAHTRRAVLSAWMCTLRQNVGSCFATAPGIIIHEEQPEFFLKDMLDLLSLGKLKRTFGGVEYSVPLSISWGSGDLKKTFSMPEDSEFEESKLWLSPALESAFRAAGLINQELSSEEQILEVKQIMRRTFSRIRELSPCKFITAEEIIHFAAPSKMDVACSAFKGIADNALLKAWEFSLASFAETKAQFTRWNLYASLGFGNEEKGGIGFTIYQVSKQKLDEANRQIADSQYEYEQVYTQLKTIESRMQNPLTEREGQWLRVEYQAKRQQFYTLEEIRNEMSSKAQKFANLYSSIIDHYDSLFPAYFQEVYDADMHDISSGPYNDSPAGFRLVYKHGRSNTSQWSYIYTAAEFIEALISFFTSTENEISSAPEFEGIQNVFSEVITEVVNQVRTKEFIETAFYRMAIAHKTPAIANPLDHLDRIEKKPWAYTSGGTINTLICCYYRLDNAPKEISRWVESPFELCVFLIDTLKQIPVNIMKRYLSRESKFMLMHSPTHAFSLKPFENIFKEAWQSDVYTYTWLRDTIVIPRKNFVEGIWLDREMMYYLVGHLAQYVPENSRHYFLRVFSTFYGEMRPKEFRDYLLEEIKRHPELRHGKTGILNADQIDSTLYSLLPLFPRSLLKQRLEDIYQSIFLSIEQRDILAKVLDMASPSMTSAIVIDADSLQNICKGLICMAFEETTSEIDYHAAVSAAAQQLGYAMPAPFIVADTNWNNEEFGFVVNPGTLDYELWRVDITGRVGFPMSSWKEWLNGSRHEPSWGVYIRPYEYGA